MTNLEKYKMYERIIDQITDEFCDSYFENGIPEYLYSLGTNFVKYEYGSYIVKAKIEQITYSLTDELRKPYFAKKPTNKDVAKIKKLSGIISSEKLEPSKIYIHVKDGNSSWASPYTDLAKGKIAFDRGVMALALAEADKNYIDNYLVKEGQFACAYCRKATDNDKKVTRDVIAAQYRNMRQSFDYCSDKCAGYDQMAHEG